MTYQVNGKQYVWVYSPLPSVGQPTYNGDGEQVTVFSL